MHPGGNEGTVSAFAASMGQEEVVQVVHNLRPWACACLTRMGATFEFHVRLGPPLLAQVRLGA